MRNVTDVDDPLSEKARELGVHYLDLAAGRGGPLRAPTWSRSTRSPVASTPRATSAIPDIRGFIGMVLDRGYAYEAGGSVYFDVSRFESFGTISHSGTEAEMLAYAAERGGNVDDPHKRSTRSTSCCGSRPLPTSRRGSHDVGTGAAGMAHRVLRPGAARARARRSTSTAAAPT